MNIKNNKFKWVRELFSDETGFISSKRLVGVLCAFALCYSLMTAIMPPEYIVEAVALLAFGCLGLSSVDKFVKIYGDKFKAKSRTMKEKNNE